MAETVGFNEQQRAELAAIIAQTIAATLAQQPVQQQQQGQQSERSASVSTTGGAASAFRARDIGYFDPSDGEAVEVKENHQIYRNVFSFTNRLRVKASTMDTAILRQNIDSCLLGKANTWYSEELAHLSRVGLRNDINGVEEWCKALEARFRDPPGKSLALLEKIRYTTDDARRQREPAAYVQAIVVNGKNAGLTMSDHSQVLLAYEHLDSELRITITEPTQQTTVAQFIEQLNSRKHVWFDLYSRRNPVTERIGQYDRNRQQGKPQFNSSSFQSPRPFFSNNFSAFRPPQSGGNSFFPPNRSSNFLQPPGPPGNFSQSYFPNESPRPNRPWNNNDQQASNQPANRPSFIGPAYRPPPPAGQGYRQPMQALTPASVNARQPPYSSRPGMPSRPGVPLNGPPYPTRAYHSEPYQYEQSDLTYYDDCYTYDGYDVEYYNADRQNQAYSSYINEDYGANQEEGSPQQTSSQTREEDITEAHYVAAVKNIRCRNCRNTFTSNNHLHRHLRRGCALAHWKDNRLGQNDDSAVSCPPRQRSEHTIPPPDVAAQVVNSTPPEVVKSNSTDLQKDGYGFRGWHYVTAMARLDPARPATAVCLDTGCTMSLIDRAFLMEEAPAVRIQQMASPIPVRGISSTVHQCSEYAIVDLFLPGKDGRIAKITREVHLVDTLKAKLLIGVDILAPEGIVTDLPRRVAVINSCDKIEIELNLSPRSAQRTKLSVACLSDASIPPFSTKTIAVRVQGDAIPSDRDLLFEPGHSVEGISVFTHIVDCSMAEILVRNDTSKHIAIQRNGRLGSIVEYDGEGCFLADAIDLPIAAIPARKPRSFNIQSPTFPHHTITIDFVVSLPSSLPDGFDSVMSITDKFTKRDAFIPGKTTYNAEKWAHLLLERLELADWGISKAIISDRDRKFVSEVWTAIFKKKGVELLYSTAYHPQTDGQSERTNQTFEIALRHYLAAMEQPSSWPTILPTMQAILNNSKSKSTGFSPNEVLYGRKVDEPIDHLTPAHQPIEEPTAPTRISPQDAIDFANINAKRHYDRRHTAMFMKVGDYANLRLHRGYILPAMKKNPKLSQQFIGPFKILRRVGRLAYELDIPPTWRIHPAFTIAMLGPAPPPDSDPFHRPRPNHPESVEVDGEPEWEIERLLDKRTI